MTTFPSVQTLKPHVSILVRDLEKSLAFYRGMFGIEPSKVRTGYAKFDVQNPPLNFVINEHAGLQEQGALSHLGIQVASTEDVAAVRKQWAEAGLFTRDEIGTDCCWAKQDKTWVRDPDGNEWEAFVVLEDQLPEQEDLKASACCAPQPASTIGKTEPAPASACGCSAGAAS